MLAARRPAAHWRRISVLTAAPTSAGLASSATACVAALRALLPPEDATPELLVHTAYRLGHDIAGRPVGPMDFVPAARGGTALVVSASEAITEISELDMPPEARFVVVDTRTPRDTGAVIAWKPDRLDAGERGIRLYADRMPELVEEQARLLRSGDLDALGQSVNEAQALLRHQMKVSTPLIDTCVDRLRASGALGVKLTGSGLGGCLFALTTANADTERLDRRRDAREEREREAAWRYGEGRRQRMCWAVLSRSGSRRTSCGSWRIGRARTSAFAWRCPATSRGWSGIGGER